MIAAIEAYQKKLFVKSNIPQNIIAGLVVGVVALPLSMAFAIASGAKPENGMYTAIISGLLVSLFGGSRVQIAGPTGAFIVILATITAKYGFGGLQIATLMAGLMLLACGFANLGGLIKYIPSPVIVGFTAGIGVIIFVGQWREFLGLPEIHAEHFHQKVWFSLLNLKYMHATTFAMASASLAILIIAPRIKKLDRIPAPLLALIFATVVQGIFKLEGVRTIGTAFGGIPQGLPHFSLPDLSLGQMLSLIGPAFTIAMLCAIESLLSAVVADGMTNTKHDSSQELIGQGLANVIAPFFGGFAATGAIARTATNIRNGGNSPLAGVVHSVTLLVILVVLAPLAEHVPLATLAAILFVVAWNMSDLGHVKYMIKCAPRADVVILLITCTLTIFADLVVAVNVGVILAMLHFMRRMSESVEVNTTSSEDLQTELQLVGLGKLPKGVLVYALDGPFFFGAVENFQRALVNTHSDPDIVIVRLRWVPFIDITGLQALQESATALQTRGIRVILCGANEVVAKKLSRANIVETIGTGNYFETFHDALLDVAQAKQ